MPTVWQLLETIPGPAAVPAVWKASLGTDFFIFRDAFLRTLPTPARSYPCPRDCGCAHKIVRHKDGTIVAVCRCEPSCCDDLHLTDQDISILELNWQKLGRAISKAFGFRARDAEVGIAHAVQVAGYGEQAVPVILTVVNDHDTFEHVVATLAGRLRGRFILIAPTSGFLDGASQGVLAGLNAVFLALDTSVIMTPQGSLRTTRQPEELLAGIVNDTKEPPPEDVALRAFRIVETLDTECPMKAPTLLTVFRLYCMKCLTTDQIAKKVGCSKGTVINRMKVLHSRLGDPRQLQRYSPLFTKIEDQIAQSKGAYVHRKSLIYDDAGHEEE